MSKNWGDRAYLVGYAVSLSSNSLFNSPLFNPAVLLNRRPASAIMTGAEVAVLSHLGAIPSYTNKYINFSVKMTLKC